MKQIADLHIHSRYSMATSKDGTPEMLDLWARKKGITLLGTGDMTHPLWRQELKDKLIPAEPGLFRLKDEFVLPEAAHYPGKSPRFVLSGEISSIYKKDGKTRKVHSLILLPGFREADAFAARLEKIGNIHSDGRLSWGCPVVTFWKLCWRSARKACISRHTSGHHIFLCLGQNPDLIP